MMKETFSVNIGGRLFNLDNEAFSALDNYLNSLKEHFGINNPDTDEIIEDIELRIAEILDGKLNPEKQVIIYTDIKEVISIMGNPEDYATDETETETENTTQQKAATGSKRLYRDGENSVLGGVCSGLAAYFGIDVVWVRIAFVIMLFLQGFGFIAYIILWIVVPRARTTSERLKMKGKPVNVENIQKSVKEEFHKVKENVNRMGNSENMERLRNTFIEILQVFASIFKYILKFVLYIIGIALVIAVIASIIALIIVIVQSNFFTSFPFWSGFHYLSPHFAGFNIIALCIAILILIPVLGLIIAGIRLLFGIKSRNHYLRATGITAWILALIVLLFVAISNDNKPVFKTTALDTYELKYPRDSVLYIHVNENPYHQHNIRTYTLFNYHFIHDEYNDKLYAEPILRIERSYNDSLSIYLKKNSRFYDGEEFDGDDYNYSWNLADSVLALDKYFSINEDLAWQLPDAEVIIKIPEGQKICLDETAKENLDAIDSKYPIWDDMLKNCPLVMTKEGLQKI